MSTILDKIKSLFIDDSRKHGEETYDKKEETRIVITEKESTESENYNASFMNSNYSSVNPHIAESDNAKYSDNIITVMPNPFANIAMGNSESSENSLQVSEETSLIKKLRKRRNRTSKARIKR